MDVNDQIHAPAALSPEKSPWYPLDRKLGGSQSCSARGGEGENSQPLPGLEPPIIQPVAERYTTELSRILWSLHMNQNRTFVSYSELKKASAAIFYFK
jgi:hypothetical protein